MSRKLTMLLRLSKMIILIAMIILLGIALEPSNTRIVHAQSSTVSSMPLVSTISSPSLSANRSGGGVAAPAIPIELINAVGIVLAAIVGLVGVIIGALITSGSTRK